MTDALKNSRSCYICKWPLNPLSSTCPACGYSQMPNPMEGGQRADDPSKAASEKRQGLRSKLDATRDAAKQKSQSRLTKKP